MTRSCPNLSYINIYSFYGHSTESIVALAEGCHYLEVIIGLGGAALGDEAFIALGAHCRKLRQISITNDLIASDSAIESFITVCYRLNFIKFESSASWAGIERISEVVRNVEKKKKRYVGLVTPMMPVRRSSTVK